MTECIFCNVIERKQPGEIVYEDDGIVAFKDINPQAPVHILICPRKHIATPADLTVDDTPMIGKLVLVANDLAQKYNVRNSGFRLVLNCNRDAGQSVYHIHVHLLGGRRMTWPPG
jgi:histidine triad (HIT) family protein